MNNFDLSDYEDDYEEPKIKTASILPKESHFNLSDYEESEEIKPKIEQKDIFKKIEAPTKTPEEINNMSVWESINFSNQLDKEINYKISEGITKGVLHGASLGYSEKIPGFKPTGEELPGTVGFGEMVGALPLLTGIGRGISFLVGLTGFGAATGLAGTAIGVGEAAATGATYGLAKETAKATRGEEFKPENIGWEALMFGALHGAFSAGSAGFKWIAGLKPGQQSQLLVDHVIPEGLKPNQYKFYQDELVPEIQNIAKKEYGNLFEKSIEDNNLKFQQEMNKTKAMHENDMKALVEKEQMSEMDFMNAERDYQNKLKQLAAQHEKDMLDIQKANSEVEKAFQESQKNYAIMKAREEAVKNAILPQEAEGTLQGRNIKQITEDFPLTPETPVPNPSLKTRIGNDVSNFDIESTAPNRQGNTTTAGRTLIEAVRANDNVDYGLVNQAYNTSRQLNAQVEAAVPNLINDLRTTQSQLMAIPKRSPPQDQLLSVVNALIDRTAVIGPRGTVIEFRPINNNLLEEQAKALRYFMDFNFEHGNARGIFTPTVNQIENAIEMSANMTGHTEAAQANKTARAMYRQWALDYDNPYIRPLRDTNNFDYSKTFESVLNTDEYSMVNNILNRSNAGQQISGIAKRALVDKKLAKFIDNPRKAVGVEFDGAMRELKTVLSPGEEQAIRQQFIQERKTPSIIAKKETPIEAPKKGKTKEITEVEIPLFKAQKKLVPPIEEVKIPLKPVPKVTPQMKVLAKKMNITPEQAMKMTETPTGWKELKRDLNKTESGRKLYKQAAKQKVRDILYEGKVQHEFKGNELYQIINKGDNFNMLSEILGEEAADELLISSKQIADKKITLDALKKIGVGASKLKVFMILGII